MTIKVMLIILVVLLALSIIIVLVNTISFKKKVEAEAASLFKNRQQPDTSVITERDLEKLPDPIQRYLRYAQVLGKPKVQTVRLRYKGSFRMKPDAAWMPLEAEQYYTVNLPSFLWFAHLQAFPLVSLVARDLYEYGRGNMHGRLLSTVPILDASGSELNQGALVRFMNEMTWFPTSFLSDYLSWEALDSSSARMTMHYGGISATATLYVNERGEITNFIAERYMSLDDKYFWEQWSTPFEEYGEFGGFRVPIKGRGVWNLKSGDFAYIQVEIESIEYDKAVVF